MLNTIEWIKDNKEWLFSGAGGLAVLGAVGWIWKKVTTTGSKSEPPVSPITIINKVVQENSSNKTTVPTTSPHKGQEAIHKPDDPSPNICSLHPELSRINYKEESDVCSKGDGESSAVAILLPFENGPKPPLRIATAKDLRARLTYYPKHQVKAFRRLDYGCWLNQAYRSIDLRVGDIAYLIAAAQDDGDAATVGNPRSSYARYSEDRLETENLPQGTYEVRVDLLGGEHGEYAETYWYELEVANQLEARRINQRTAT